MELSYKLDKFEGPLDLLLHLIEKDKINIYDIPISSITKQYMEYIDSLDFEDLDFASEFLLMAVTLIDIKAKLLLPKEVDEESGEEIDPRAELVERLLEYKKYKKLSLELINLYDKASYILYKDESLPKEVLKYKPKIDVKSLFEEVDINKLSRIFEDVLKRKEERIDKQREKFGNIKKEEISLSVKLSNVFSYAKNKKKFSFKNLLTKQGSKLEVVVTFLAVLELMKVGAINLYQENIFDDMHLEFNSKVDEAMLNLENVEDL